MMADTGRGAGIWEKFAAPDRCWCCKRPFAGNGVAPVAAHREWLAFQLAPHPPLWGICEQCATERNACPRCGRVPGLAADGNPFLQTWALQDGDEEGLLGDDRSRLSAAGLEELAAYCEPCVVRDHLMEVELPDALPRKVAFGLAVIVARHQARALHLGQQGLPVPEEEAERVEQLASIICAMLIYRPETLEHVVAIEARDPTHRRALGLLAERCMGEGRPMHPLLRQWVQRRDNNELPKQVSNSPVQGHGASLIALILALIGSLPWVVASRMKATRNRATDPDLSICGAVTRGLREYGYRFEVARKRIEEAMELLGRNRPDAHEALSQLNTSKHQLVKAPYQITAVMSRIGNATNCLEAYLGGDPGKINLHKAKALLKSAVGELDSYNKMRRSYCAVEKICERKTNLLGSDKVL